VELNDLYYSPSIVRVIKSGRMRWAGRASHTGERRVVEVCTGFWWGNLRERDHFEDPGIEGKIILRRISGSGMWGYRPD
jgi:hypothetical protein